MPNQKPLNVAVIGTGIFAYRHLKAYEKLSDKYNLVACSNRSRDKAEKFAQSAGIVAGKVYDDPFELIKSPEIHVVDVIVPIQNNLEFAKAAIAAGKHIILEKPISHNLVQARELVKLSQNSKTIVFIAENHAYKPRTQQIAQIIQSGTIGEIVTFSYNAIRTYNLESPYYATKWRQTPEHPGGYISDGGVHDMCTLTTAVGQVAEVTGFSTTRYPIHGAEDTLTVTLKLKDGTIGTFILTFCATKPSLTLFDIYGTNGMVRVQNDRVELYDAEGNLVPTDLPADPRGFTDVEGELDNFYKAVHGDEKLVIKPEDAFHHFAVIVAALESAKSGKVEKVQSV